MIREGESAPTFDLPGVVDGDVMDFSLADHLGEEVVVVAFYPGDFNPACTDADSDLGDLDLFTIQQDVAVCAVSADSVFSHRAFADAYDLQLPLLSDLRANVAAEYGVVTDDESAGHLVDRAVFVLDLEGDVEFAWRADDVAERPPEDRIRAAVEGVGAGGTAYERYADGHEDFEVASDHLASGLEAFDEEEWPDAHDHFEAAMDGFERAHEEFHTAARFAEDEEKAFYFERAEDQTETFGHATEWLAEAADAFEHGEGAEGMALREDAQGPLDAARAVHDPIPPAEFPPEGDPAGVGPGSDDGASLGMNLDDAIAEVEAEAPTATGSAGGEDGAASGSATPAGAGDGVAGEVDEDEDIDDDELAAITAELEGGSGDDEPETIAEAIAGADGGNDGEGASDTGGQGDQSDEPSGENGAEADGDVELDLTDPTDGDDELLEPTERGDDETAGESAGEEADS